MGTWPAERDWGNPSPRLPACPCPVFSTTSAAWPGTGIVRLLAMPQLPVQASCPLTGHNIGWPVVSSAEISFIFSVSRGLCPCYLGTAELRVDGVYHSLREARINVQEGAKQICLRSSPKPHCSLAQLYNEGWKLGGKAKWG